MANARTHGLDGVFRQRSAVVGASRQPGSISRQVVANLVAAGCHVPVYPVNPKAVVVRSGSALRAPAADVVATEAALLRLQQLVVDVPRIAKVEARAFILARVGGGSAAVDARLRMGAL